MTNSHLENRLAPAWPPERVEKLRHMWAEGLSASDIADRLQEGLSRSAVLGKVMRLKLSKRRSIEMSPEILARRAEQRRKQKEKRAAYVRTKRVIRVKEHIQKIAAPPVSVATVLPVDRIPRSEAWEALPCSAPVSLVDLEPHQCKWPLGDGAPWLACGLPTDKTYCPQHQALGTFRS